MTNRFCAHSSVILVFINKHQNDPLVNAETVRHSSTHTLFSIYWQIYLERILILIVTSLFLVESLQQSNHSKMSCGCNGPLARYVKLRVAHAPGMPGTFSSSPRVYDPDMHHGTCVMHVPWIMPGSLTSGSFEIGGVVNVPGIPGACATRNFTYLVRDPFHGRRVPGDESAETFMLESRWWGRATV